MHIYFSGIGGSGLGPLSLIAHQIGYDISGSDKSDSTLIEYLRHQGIKNIFLNQCYETIESLHQQKPIDWFVYSSAIVSNDHQQQEMPSEMKFCFDNKIKMTKRDEFLNKILRDKQLTLISIAGTHGKSTTTSMIVWLFKQLNIPISYSIGAQMIDGQMSEYNIKSTYFIYETDEYDRNFLSFYPYLSIISGIDWDHPDTYPTRSIYLQSFEMFCQQSQKILLWKSDLIQLNFNEIADQQHYLTLIDDENKEINENYHLIGHVNRRNAYQSVESVHLLTKISREYLNEQINHFPGLSRRFETICPYLFTDYAHTIPKIRGALNCLEELQGNSRFIVIYEGFQNVRQHLIKNDLKDLFECVEHLYIVPIYLSREDLSLRIFQPEDLKSFLSNKTQLKSTTIELNDQLKDKINESIQNQIFVLGLSAGTTKSLDQWLRKTFSIEKFSSC